MGFVGSACWCARVDCDARVLGGVSACGESIPHTHAHHTSSTRYNVHDLFANYLQTASADLFADCNARAFANTNVYTNRDSDPESNSELEL